MKIKGLYQKRGWYYYRPAQKDGVRPPAVALGTKDEEEAIAKVYELHTEGGLERNVTGSKVKMLTVLEEWLVDARAVGVHRPKTTATSRSCLTDLAKFWGNPTVGWITRERILQWRSHLVERPGRGGRTISEASVASYMRRLQGFLSWCVRRRYLRKSPMDEIKIPQVKITKRQQFCTVEERELLLADPPSDEVEFILLFGFFCGLRFGEMLAMEASWLTESGENMFLSVQVTDQFSPKDGELRVIPVHPRIKTFLERYGMRKPFMLAADKSKWVELPGYRFNPKKQFKNYVIKKKLPWVTYHTLRHSFATHLAMKGASMIEVESALGDTLAVTERTYIGNVPGTASTITTL
jgi:integrase